MAINPYLPSDHAFDSEMVALMSDAFVAARAEILSRPELLVSDDEIAKIIIGRVSGGEADSAQLVQYVLARFPIDDQLE